MSRPNLFDHATSELSQDAILAWLLRWADPQYAQADPQLHQVGQFFIQKLYEKAGGKVPTFTSLKVSTQENKIDILVRLDCVDGHSRGILIEDKIGANEHNGQLSRYLDSVVGKGVKRENILALFIKTGFQENWDEVINKGYSPITVFDLETVWQHGVKMNIQNAIFEDFWIFLQRRKQVYIEAQQAFEGFSMQKIGEWTYWHWRGFFSTFKSHFKAEYRDVHTAREDLLAFFFGHIDISFDRAGERQNFRPYLDLVWANKRGAYLNIRVDLNSQKGFTQQLRDRLAAEVMKQDLFKNSRVGRYKSAEQTILLLVLELNLEFEAKDLVDHLERLNAQFQKIPRVIHI